MNIIDREAWLEQRRTGIGGSDAAAVLGMSKWRTPLSVWLDKTGQAIDAGETEPMRWGTLLEPVIRQEYSNRTGRAVMAPGFLRHPRHGFMVANVDGVTADQRLVEIKTARTAEAWGEPGSDQVPDDYLIQVQHYLAVLEFSVADIAVLIGGSDFRIYTVEADPELQEIMIGSEAAFWQSVVDHVPPAPMSFADAQALYGRHATKDSVAVASQEVLDAIARLRRIRADQAMIQEAEEAEKAVIMAAMGGNDTLVDAAGKIVATWKLSAAPKRLDGKALAAAHPDIYSDFLRNGEPSRRFLLKGESQS